MITERQKHPEAGAGAEFIGFVGSVFPEAGQELLRLYQSAADNAGLLRTDFYTIRDLVDLSGHADEPVQVLLLCLLLALEEGSLCIEASAAGLHRRLADLVADDEARHWATSVAGGLSANGFPGLVGSASDKSKPVILVRRGDTPYLYFQKLFRQERDAQEELRKRLASSGSLIDTTRYRHVLGEVLQERPLRIQGMAVRLGRHQRLAVALALLRDFVIISGGPGTGKTSIVVTLVRCLVRSGFAPARIALAAPTGRAAQRLTDAIRTGLASLAELSDTSADWPLRDVAATTLHQLLSYRPTRGTFARHAENPIPADVVIVDEVSMVGLGLMAQLLQALEPRTKVVLLGDKDQLPSVDAGALLAHLVPDGHKPSYRQETLGQLAELLDDVSLPACCPGPLEDVVVILEENFRSQSDICEVARAINQQRTDMVDSLPCCRPDVSVDELDQRGGCWLLDQPAEGSTRELRAVLDRWAAFHYLSTTGPLAASRSENDADNLLPHDQLDHLFTLLGRGRLLTLVREGPWGCVDINRYFEQLLRPHLDRGSRGGLFAGAPVLITRNDYGRQLFNGDVGMTLAAPGGGYRVVFQRQGGYMSIPADALPPHELGFALTVHKSQGSEYDQVLLVLPPSGGRKLLTKEIIYTGITRARRLALICGPKEVVRTAIGRRIVRESGLTI